MNADFERVIGIARDCSFLLILVMVISLGRKIARPATMLPRRRTIVSNDDAFDASGDGRNYR